MSPPTSRYETASQSELRSLEHRMEALEGRLRDIYAEKAEQAKAENERFFRRVELASAFGAGFFTASMLWAVLG